jgi:hypothetical protein
LGHKKIESTVRYLGIEVDDALAIAETSRRLIYRGRAEQLCPSTRSERCQQPTFGIARDIQL